MFSVECQLISLLGRPTRAVCVGSHSQAPKTSKQTDCETLFPAQDYSVKTSYVEPSNLYLFISDVLACPVLLHFIAALNYKRS